jgi:hypothetical protein
MDFGEIESVYGPLSLIVNFKGPLERHQLGPD